MKKLSFVAIIFAFVMCFMFTGCATQPLEMPQNLTVSSNGGFVVKVGDYKYFANAYKSYENLTEKADNDGEKVKQNAIKRFNDTEAEKKYELVANKIAGFQTSNMFVVNEYLYFTSPNVHKNDSKEKDEYGKYQFELTSLFRIKLDGTGLVELYTTETSSAKFCLVGNTKKSFLIFDDSKILGIDCSNNSTKVEPLVEKVTDAILPYSYDNNTEIIYFTTDREEGDLLTGNLLKKLDLSTKEVTTISDRNGETFGLISYSGDRLFYTRTGVETTKGLYSLKNGESESQLHRYDTTSTKIFVVTISMYDKDLFVFENNNKIYVQDMTADNDADCTLISNGTAKLAFVDKTYAYYTTEDGIYRVSVLEGRNIQQVSNVKDFNADCLDFDGRYVYFFAKAENATTETKYLYSADTFACGSNEIITECLAELLEEDIKKDEAKSE